MMDKKTEVKNLYEDAVYLHFVHNGRDIRRCSVRIFWNDEGLM